jgi:peptidoglycan/LPS O-acetylase OafA/YrhL
MHDGAVGFRGWQLGHRPALDGLRGVAILLVLVCHVGGSDLLQFDRFHALGSAGVEMFFALSGFLITSLLIEERGRTGRVSLRNFYGRRARRLFPALALLLAAALVVRTIVGGAFAPSVWPAIVYAANWAQIRGTDLGALDPTWSLSIEEQFYLVWPLAFLAVARWRNGPLLVASLGITGSLIVRFAVGGQRAYFGSDTQAASLLVGCVLAILMHRTLRSPAWHPIVPAALAGSSLIFLLCDGRWVGDVVVPTVVPLLTCVAIWLVCGTRAGILGWEPLRYVGRRSYALYLWHLPCIFLMGRWLGVSLGSGLLAICAALAVAEASWRLVENPILSATTARASLPAPAPA